MSGGIWTLILIIIGNTALNFYSHKHAVIDWKGVRCFWNYTVQNNKLQLHVLNSLDEPHYFTESKVDSSNWLPICNFFCSFLSHRAIAPVIVGSSFAWSISEGFKLGFPLNEHFAFAILVIITVMSILLSCLLPEGLNRRYVTAERVWSQ